MVNDGVAAKYFSKTLPAPSLPHRERRRIIRQSNGKTQGNRNQKGREREREGGEEDACDAATNKAQSNLSDVKTPESSSSLDLIANY